MTSSTRREARERALSLLYEAEAKEMSGAAVLADLPLEAEPFVAGLVRGVGEHLEQIDELVDKFAIDWDVERMPSIDRNVLRLAIYELLERPEIPVGAVISEAVELAKRYSTDDSGRFVNGVLASVAGEVRTSGGRAG
ncbi:MAG TPA: transcription antitermination factor NusB [Acidimicrobiales bacterium]|nr:transcription antitermination factor NusB [Acidimicrobiales bacterium]